MVVSELSAGYAVNFSLHSQPLIQPFGWAASWFTETRSFPWDGTLQLVETTPKQRPFQHWTKTTPVCHHPLHMSPSNLATTKEGRLLVPNV